MKELCTRKLHPILEVLIVAAFVLGVSLLISLLINPYMIQLIRTATWSITLIGVASSILGMFLGSVICFRLIEKRPVHWGVLLLISIAYELMVWGPETVVNIYVASFGEQALMGYAKVSAYVLPVLAATVMTLAVRLLTAPKEENAPPVKIGLFGHVLLLLFTCGIWNLIWIYRTTRYLNCMPDEPYRNPATKLLLCMFIPFYSIYWIYKSAQRIDKLAKMAEVVSDLAVVCLILEIFIPLIPPILMQDKINKITQTQQHDPEI